MFRTTRASAALTVLAAVLLGLLGCGASHASGGTAPSAAPVVMGAAVPGCDPGHPADLGDAGPVVPPRASGFAELLPALGADRTLCGVRQPDLRAAATPPGREPPARVPTPVELSVLRV
ncbi:hypothetical protein HHL19_32190 [Streptomyces sp. R302]|uniref:hypothetical protein n=1 Tax=unclassified Streptomyces TaxID=2593676 RepID=UPI00145FBA30|nr:MULTISPECIES: hypothetical protein [unclassified Streptomyces]NML53925.1 hypothetical protein [Streptomyces sp. R301]NML83185.1 hypothetical protein [Streptomyces sp. R302]